MSWTRISPINRANEKARHSVAFFFVAFIHFRIVHPSTHSSFSSAVPFWAVQLEGAFMSRGLAVVVEKESTGQENGHINRNGCCLLNGRHDTRSSSTKSASGDIKHPRPGHPSRTRFRKSARGSSFYCSIYAFLNVAGLFDGRRPRRQQRLRRH